MATKLRISIFSQVEIRGGGRRLLTVEQPVAGSGDGQGLGTDLERVKLTSVDPAARTPGGSEEEDVEADEGNENLVGGFGLGSNTDDGDDVLADAHADGAHQKERPATHSLNEIHTGQGGDDVDNVGNDADDEGVVDAGLLEELCAVVEDEVDTSELLENLDTAANKETLAVDTTKKVGIGSLANGKLILVVGLDLGDFGSNGFVVLRELAETSEGLGGTGQIVLLDKVTRSLGENKHTGDQDDGPGELDGNGNTVGAGIVTLLRSLVNDGRKEDADSYGELIGANDGTTDPFGHGFGLIERNKGGNETDTETSNDTANGEQRNGGSCSLEDNADGENDRSVNETPASTKDITERSSSQSAYSCN